MCVCTTYYNIYILHTYLHKQYCFTACDVLFASENECLGRGSGVRIHNDDDDDDYIAIAKRWKV